MEQPLLHDRLEQMLAPQHLGLRRDDGDDVGGRAARTAFGERLVHHDLGARATLAHLDAVALLERLDQLVRVLGREGGVEEDATLLARALEEALLAVGAFIARELRQRLRVQRRAKEEPCAKECGER